ncbi:hypothetical protein JTE90_008155 [Oedothorax gibbosus]|uniref:Uncharacterized protein n=1 Tax=Oedothorax gibbosus TaxID=931172 RepID=A0AAV6VEP4_9ARAC|nr:hypothetical protein JTE90_008155 [Oedothorax gibbosus]
MQSKRPCFTTNRHDITKQHSPVKPNPVPFRHPSGIPTTPPDWCRAHPKCPHPQTRQLVDNRDLRAATHQSSQAEADDDTLPHRRSPRAVAVGRGIATRVVSVESWTVIGWGVAPEGLGVAAGEKSGRPVEFGSAERGLLKEVFFCLLCD